MPFRPLNDRHAIKEVVFAINFERVISENEIARLQREDAPWRQFLPNVTRDQTLFLHMGPAPPQGPPPPAGINFQRMKPDGSLDWRLRVADNVAVVNCLTYTRWADIWPEARSFLKDSIDILAAADNLVGGIGLQYIDVFVWEGDITDYDSSRLVRRDSPALPQTIFDRGPLWHMHQGWFRDDDLPAQGRLLERTHIDAQEKGQVYSVQIDTSLRLDLRDAVAADVLFAGDDAQVDKIYEHLHLANKRVLAELLTAEAADRIALNA